MSATLDEVREKVEKIIRWGADDAVWETAHAMLDGLWENLLREVASRALEVDDPWAQDIARRVAEALRPVSDDEYITRWYA